MNPKPTIVALSMCLVMLAVLLGFSAAPEPRAERPPEDAAAIDASAHPSLQAALDALPSSGGIVRLPPGTFEIRAPLVLTKGNTRIEGAGPSTRIVNRDEAGRPALHLRPATGSAASGARIWRIELTGFRITASPKSGDGILAEGVNEIYIHGVWVDHNGGHGIRLVDCYEDPRVSDSIITYNAQAGVDILRGHDIVVSANQFEENRDALRCIDSFNLCMSGNNLDDHLRHGIVVENTYGSVISGNMIEECRGTAIIIDRDCYGITIASNVIAHNFGGGVDLRDAWGSTVSANTFTIVAKRALVVGPESGRITISANNFSNSHIGGRARREDPATGVVLDHTRDIAVSGNVFAGLAGEAVRVEGRCPRLAVSGNVASDLPGSAGGRVLE